MSLKLYTPFQELRQIEKSLFSKSGYYKPATDLYESDDEYTIEMNLPGFTRDQISIDATFDTVEVKAQIEEISEEITKDDASEVEPEWTAKHIERSSRNYFRKIKFNKPLDAQKSKTSFVNGVLKISIPKAPEAKRVTLSIE